MNLIAFMIAAFIIVLIAYVMLAETIQRQEKSLTSNAMQSKTSKYIKIQLNNNTNKEDK